MKHFLHKITFWEWLIVIAGALILAIVVTYPSITFLHSAYIGDGGDNYEYAGYMGLAARSIMHGMWPFQHTNFWRYPVGFDFARGFDSYLTMGIGTLLTILFGLPFSYNLTILLLLAANGVTYYAFFRKLTDSRFLGTIGSLICGFSFYSIARAGGHPNLLFTGCFALFGLAILRLLQSESYTPTLYATTFGVLLLTALGSLEYLLIIIMFSICMCILLFFVDRKTLFSMGEKIKVSLLPLVLIGFGFACLFSLFYYPQISAMLQGTFVILNRTSELTALTPSIGDFFVPNSYLHLFISHLGKTLSDPSIEKLVFFGWIELALFIAFFIFTRNTRLKILVGSITLISFALSLGYGAADHFTLLPYHFLGSVFPFSAIPESGRFGLITIFVMAICIVILLSRLPHNKYRAVILSLICVFLLFERIPSSFYKTSAFLTDPAIAVIQKEQTSAVLDIPINPYYPRYDTLSILYNKPIVNGYFHWSADSEKEKSFLSDNLLMTRYMCLPDNSLLSQQDEQQADITLLNTLKQNGIRTIVIHKDDKYYHTVCTNVRERLNNLIPTTYVVPKAFPVEKQLTGNIVNGKASFSLFFPQSGKFYLDGLYIAPNKQLSISILEDSQPVTFQYSFNSIGKDDLQLSPQYTITTHVESGSHVTIQAPVTDTNLFFSLWYRYDADPLTPINSLNDPLVKVYEDSNTAVYHIQ